MIFNRIHSPLLFFYDLRNSIILRCDGFVMDLGFKLSSNFDTGLYIGIDYCKALRILGIITRLSKVLSFLLQLKFYSVLKYDRNLKYGAILWDTHTADNVCQVKRVQRRFLRFASYFLGVNMTHPLPISLVKPL